MTRLRPILLVTLLSVCALAPAAARAQTPTWTGRLADRLAMLALLQTLNADLLSHDSATLTLDRWCGAHHLATPAQIVAERDRDAEQPPDAEQRQQLGVGPSDPVRFRRVRLRCGTHVLSEADNWYVPARLTPAMNAALDGTDTAFGRAVQPLHFSRHTLSATLLWSPLPQGWENGAKWPVDDPAPLTIPHHLLQHRAVLTLPHGTPFCEVVETYTDAVLAFPPPR